MRAQLLSWLLLGALASCTSTSQQAEPASGSAGSVGGGGSAGGRDVAGRSAAGSGGAGRSANGGAGGSRAGAGGAGQAGAGLVDGGAADGGKAADDAGSDEVDAAVACEGEIVADQGGCLQDDAFCYPLADGRYCTGPAAPECPANSTPIAKDAPCPARTSCWDYSQSLRCARRLFTIAECELAGGVALPDPGDGSLVCPGDAVAFGAIEGAGWDEGGLCCASLRRCGARAGDTCTAEEYCAYQVGQLCGMADAQASCKKRPTTCSGAPSPVCGCDQTTYASECEANAAGSGIYAAEACR